MINPFIPIGISLASFISMMLYIYFIMGFKKSISETFYGMGRNKKLIFWSFTTGYALPLFMVGYYILMKLAVAGICFVAVASDYRGWKVTEAVHMYGAFGGTVLAMLAIIIDMHLWPLVALNAAICGLIWLNKWYNEQKPVLYSRTQDFAPIKRESQAITWMETSSYLTSVAALYLDSVGLNII